LPEEPGIDHLSKQQVVEIDRGAMEGLATDFVIPFS
jgi:hypothetical protein